MFKKEDMLRLYIDLIPSLFLQRVEKKLVDNNGGFACTFETNDALS